IFARSPVGLKKDFDVAPDPRGNRAYPVDGPGEHGAAVDVLNKPGQLAGFALAELASGNGLVEKLLGLVPKSAELRESDGMKLRVGQINLEVGEAVGHSLGSGSKSGAFCIQLD